MKPKSKTSVTKPKGFQENWKGQRNSKEAIADRDDTFKKMAELARKFKLTGAKPSIGARGHRRGVDVSKLVENILYNRRRR